jgi:NADPH-dependent 2,4-dienoyl-CoA reductase/sulfur reductase-like enzyme
MVGIEDSKCLNAEDVRKNAQELEQAGADAIMVRSHWLGHLVGGFLPDYLFYPEPPIPLKSFPKEYYWKERGAGATIHLAEQMKKVISIPVIVVGRITTELGEKFLREGKADFIGMTRALFCDPGLPNKLAEGKMEDIRPCTACGTCIDETYSNQRRCRINAFLGEPGTYELKPAPNKKRVVVIGGGPGGMEAARVAAERGHEVILYEKERKLGGLLPIASVVKGLELEDLPAIVRYFKTQLGKLGVKIELGKEFDSSMVEKVKPEVVIVATGGVPTVPELRGIKKHHVINALVLHRQLKFYLRFLGPRVLVRLTRFWIPIGKRVVIIGGGLHGCEVAEFLVKRGRKVTILDKAEKLGEGMIDFRLWLLLEWFRKKGVTSITGIKSVEITDKGVDFVDNGGNKRTIEADKIIPVQPLAPNMELFKSLEGKAPEVYAIGDCQEPRLIVDAIADGFCIARAI